VSTDNVRYTYLLPGFMLGKRFQQHCNHEICTSTLFFMTKCWGEQKILFPPLSKSWGEMSTRPPNKLGPCAEE